MKRWSVVQYAVVVNGSMQLFDPGAFRSGIGKVMPTPYEGAPFGHGRLVAAVVSQDATAVELTFEEVDGYHPVEGFTTGLPALTDALTGNAIQKIDAGARLFYALYHHPSAQGLLRASDSGSRDLRDAYRSAAGAYLPRDLWTDHAWRMQQDQTDAPPAPPS